MQRFCTGIWCTMWMSTPEGRALLLSIITLLVGLGVPIAFPEVDPIWGFDFLIAAGVLATATAILAVYHYVPRNSDPSKWYMPMRLAAQRAYEKTRDSPLAELIYRLEKKNPTDVLVSYAELIRDTAIPIYGARPPSQKMEIVPRDRYHLLWFTDDLSGLKPIGGPNRPEYAQVSILRRHFRRALREIRQKAQADRKF